MLAAQVRAQGMTSMRPLESHGVRPQSSHSLETFDINEDQIFMQLRHSAADPSND
jgi:hypothetical protein